MVPCMANQSPEHVRVWLGVTDQHFYDSCEVTAPFIRFDVRIKRGLVIMIDSVGFLLCRINAAASGFVGTNTLSVAEQFFSHH